jgi:endonuclease-3
MAQPMSFFIAHKYHNDPFLILISCLLSLRARDTVTLPISEKLFSQAKTPQALLKISVPELEKIIHPIGFFHQKARTLHNVSRDLIKRFHSKVPDNEEDLLSMKGVGRKTANLVLGVAFNIPAICVDTHVHRLANQLGLVTTKTPEQTEYALKKIVPKKDWIELNRLLVVWGQQVPRGQQVAILKKALSNYKSTR